MVRYIEEEPEYATMVDDPVRGYLALIVQERVSQVLPLKNRTQIGRDKSNDIVVADQKVSRYHATVNQNAAGFTIGDNGSANGTYLNDLMVKQDMPLKHNDQLDLGNTTFVFMTTKPEIDSPVVIKQRHRSDVAIPAPAPQKTKVHSIPSESTSINHAPAQQTYLLWTIGCMALVIVTLLIGLSFLFGTMWNDTPPPTPHPTSFILAPQSPVAPNFSEV